MAPTASRISAYAVTMRTGRDACSSRAWRRVSNPDIPDMRTSEIIIAKEPARNAASAWSPEETDTVSNPWLLRNESSRLRWPGSSSTTRIRCAGARLARVSVGIANGWISQALRNVVKSAGQERPKSAAPEESATERPQVHRTQSGARTSCGGGGGEGEGAAADPPGGTESPVSSIPSARLEQEAHRFGLRDNTLPNALIGSPQQMQIVGFNGRNDQHGRDGGGRCCTSEEPFSKSFQRASRQTRGLILLLCNKSTEIPERQGPK